MASTDLSDPLGIALALMEIDSTSGHEGAVIARAECLLAGDGWRTTRIPVSDGRDALFATAHDAPLATLSTHLDTVPPFIAPSLDGDRLRGRGACDAKGIAAAMIVAARRLRARDVPVAMLFVVGEETMHDGARAASDAVRRGLVPGTSRVLVNGEPTESTLAVGTKGALRAVVRTIGRAAHSAYPTMGRSAIHDLVTMLAELDALELPRDALLGDTTINIGSIAGGVADNVFAPSAEARLMVRLVSEAERLEAILARWAHGRAEIEIGTTVPPVRLAALGGYATSVAAYATDIPELGEWGTPYLFGPGSIHVAHTDDEWISVREMRDAVGAYERIVERALSARAAQR
jgi:acetylornithine deacetylase